MLVASRLEDLEIYVLASAIGDSIWGICTNWGFFAKTTVGIQLSRAADSVAANIAEGFGRFYYKENIRFFYLARGSLEETKNWLTRAKSRSLISDAQFRDLWERINLLGRKLNACISGMKSLGT